MEEVLDLKTKNEKDLNDQIAELQRQLAAKDSKVSDMKSENLTSYSSNQYPEAE